jgi:hypothetical protein
MTTPQDRKSLSKAKIAINFWPTKGSEASIFLAHSADYLKGYTEWPERAKPNGLRPKIGELDYNDRKSSQLLEALSDLIMAETRIASWYVDLGFDGQCQPDEVDEVEMMRLDEPVSQERLDYIADVVRQSKIADGTIENSSIGGVPCIMGDEDANV